MDENGIRMTIKMHILPLPTSAPQNLHKIETLIETDGIKV